MFSSIRIMFMAILISAVAGAGVYVVKLRADNATLKANQLQLEQGIQEQKKLLEQQEKDFNAIMESNKKLNVMIQTFKKDLDELDKRFNKNKRGDNAARCVELASGAEHTEAELKATKRSEINPECPALANPSYVPY